MRPKIAIIVLLAGVAGVLGLLTLKHLAGHPQRAATPTSLTSAAPTAGQAVPTASKPTASNPVNTTAAPSETVDTNALAEKHEAEVQAHIDRLQELQANDDKQSLHEILAELTNPDKEIRDAAVEATIQFGSRDAIPELKDLATRTDDAEEKKAFLDAAEFLALPTLMEAKAQNAAPPQTSPPPAAPDAQPLTPPDATPDVQPPAQDTPPATQDAPPPAAQP